jgi:hypothetical protein
MSRSLLLLGLLALGPLRAAALEPSVRLAAGPAELLISGILDLEAYRIDRTAPGLLFQDESFLNPRLTLFAEGFLGSHLFVLVQARADRGFDPGYLDSLEVRLDEYFARVSTAGARWSLALQAGKFATPLGNFVPRHDSMHNRLVRAPLPYDYMTTIGDLRAPAGLEAHLARRDVADLKHVWVPIVWGPVYHTGVMAFGHAGPLELRVALTNAAPSERPLEWDWSGGDAGTLVPAARLGLRPFPGLEVGLNATRGPYLSRVAESTLPAGTRRSDFAQTLWGLDVQYARGHLVVFAELFRTEWQVPNVPVGLGAVAGYVEARYTLRPGLYVAGRYGRIEHDEVADVAGGRTAWDYPATRVELGAGYFLSERLLAKLQYEWNTQGGAAEEGADVLSASLSFGF